MVYLWGYKKLYSIWV